MIKCVGKNYIRVKNHVTFHAPERKLQNEYITKNMTNAVKEMECNRVRGYWDPTDSKTGMILSMTCPYVSLISKIKFIRNNNYF